MTRDFDLIREILFQVEKSPSGEPLQFLSFKHKIVTGQIKTSHLRGLQNQPL